MTKSAKQGTDKAPAESAATESAATQAATDQQGAEPADAGRAAQEDQAGQDAETAPDLDETKRKFREALERKRAKHADANAARSEKGAEKVHGARGLARSRRSFRRKTGG